MHYDALDYDLRDAVACITLNRPDAQNALNTQMRAELVHAVQRAGNEARAIVLTGAGDTFCAGQDLGERANVGQIDLERTLRDEYVPLIAAVADSPVPTIAAVNGAAAGTGANLALACDVVIAAASAVFAQTFSRIGLIPDGGGTYWLPRQMGLAKAMGAALFAEPISAQQAESWGMIWEAVPDADFAARWQSRAAHLASGPSATYRAIKQALREGYGNDLSAQMEFEARLQGECGHSRDFKEGIVAFMEKRPARFEGR